MKILVEVPNGHYCRVWGTIHCPFNDDRTSKLIGICRFNNVIVYKDVYGQCMKNSQCPTYKKNILKDGAGI